MGGCGALIRCVLIVIGGAAGSAATITVSYLLPAAFPGCLWTTANLATQTDPTCGSVLADAFSLR